MIRPLLIIYFGLLIGCTDSHTKYYYGEKKFRGFPCSWDHYIVIEDKGDSFRVWNLDDECNAGYWSTGNMTIPKIEGLYGDLNIKKITEGKINVIYDRRYEKVDFTLTRARNKHDAIRVVNITQMLNIDSELEQYIQANAKNAKKANLYLTQNYTADDKAGELDPNEFHIYYRAKKEKVAATIIKQLATDQR